MVQLKLYFLLAFSVFVLAGCQSQSNQRSPHTSPQPQNDSSNQNEVEVHLSGISHVERFKTFVQNAQHGKQATVTIKRYTTEGDPIFYKLIFDGKLYHYTFDNSRDTFGGTGKGVQKTTCKKLESTETSKSESYNLIGCQSDSLAKTFDFSVPK